LNDLVQLVVALGVLVNAVIALIGVLQNRSLKAGQAVMKEQLDGVTEGRVTAGHALGKSEGDREGTDREQLRERTRVAAADASAERLAGIEGEQK
jgi:hypothetical protein